MSEADSPLARAGVGVGVDVGVRSPPTIASCVGVRVGSAIANVSLVGARVGVIISANCGIGEAVSEAVIVGSGVGPVLVAVVDWVPQRLTDNPAHARASNASIRTAFGFAPVGENTAGYEPSRSARRTCALPSLG